MILATKQGQKGLAQPDSKPYTNPTPTLHPGVPVGTPGRKAKLRTCKRQVVPGKHTLGRSLIDWLGGLTLSGGDLDGEPFTVWPWEKRFIIVYIFGQPGNAALSIGRGNGKSAFVAALAAAVVCPGAPLHDTKREVVCVASSFQQARVIFEDVLSYTRSLGHDLGDRELWRRQDSQNMATLEYVRTGARVRCVLEVIPRKPTVSGPSWYWQMRAGMWEAWQKVGGDGKRLENGAWGRRQGVG